MAHRYVGFFAALLLQFAALGTATAADPGDRALHLVRGICANCHGEDGNSRQALVPKLAGQHAGYLKRQIRDFMAGTRKHELMTGFLSRLGDEDVDALGAFFSAQKPAPGTRGDARLAERGKTLYFQGSRDAALPSCDGCHSADAAGSPRFPRLAGQHPDYLVKQLKDIKDGRRVASPLMKAVADRVSEDEMRALAIYLGGL
jgi:cytochrome c553